MPNEYKKATWCYRVNLSDQRALLLAQKMPNELFIFLSQTTNKIKYAIFPDLPLQQRNVNEDSLGASRTDILAKLQAINSKTKSGRLTTTSPDLSLQQGNVNENSLGESFTGILAKLRAINNKTPSERLTITEEKALLSAIGIDRKLLWADQEAEELRYSEEERKRLEERVLSLDAALGAQEVQRKNEMLQGFITGSKRQQEFVSLQAELTEEKARNARLTQQITQQQEQLDKRASDVDQFKAEIIELKRKLQQENKKLDERLLYKANAQNTRLEQTIVL